MKNLTSFIKESMNGGGFVNEAEDKEKLTVSFMDIGFYKKALKILKDGDYKVSGDEESKKIVVDCDGDDCDDVTDYITGLLNDDNIRKFTIK